MSDKPEFDITDDIARFGTAVREVAKPWLICIGCIAFLAMFLCGLYAIMGKWMFVPIIACGFGAYCALDRISLPPMNHSEIMPAIKYGLFISVIYSIGLGIFFGSVMLVHNMDFAGNLRYFINLILLAFIIHIHIRFWEIAEGDE